MDVTLADTISVLAISRSFATADDPLKTALESLPYLGIVFLPVLGFPRIPPSLLNAFKIHAVLGVITCGFVLVTNRGIVTADVVDRADTLALKPVQFALYSLLCSSGFRRYPIVRAVVVIGIIEMMAFAVVSGTRQAIVLLSGVVLCGLWISMRAYGTNSFKSIHSRMRVTKKMFLAGTVVMALIAGSYMIATRLTGGMELFTSRLSSQGDRTSIRQNSRWYEIQLLIEQFDVQDYALGRGVRGTFINPEAPKQDSVHIGWFRSC